MNGLESYQSRTTIRAAHPGLVGNRCCEFVISGLSRRRRSKWCAVLGAVNSRLFSLWLGTPLIYKDTAEASGLTPDRGFLNVDNRSADRDTLGMSSLALEIDLALQRLDPPKASRLERLLRDGLALALGDEAVAAPTPSPAAGSRSELFARRFAPLNAVPDRDLSDIVNENRGES